jgi:hypothetical protein
VGRDLDFYGNQILGNEYIFKDCQTNYFDVTRTINTNQAATIQVVHSNTGGAVNGTHYTAPGGGAVSQNVSFAAGEVTKRIALRATSSAVPGSHFTLTMMCPCEGSTVAITKKIYIYDFVQSFSASPTSSCSSGANGRITITATGTSGKYEYRLGSSGNWQTSNVFTGLSPGTYTVYVRDIGSCAANPLSHNVTIQNLTANAGTNITNCNNNVFNLSANAPGTGETGKWTRISGGNVTFTNANLYNTKATLTSGSSAVIRWTLSNGSCSSFAQISITNEALPTVPSVTTPVSFCQGGTANPLSATPGSGYTLRWYSASDVFLGTTAPTPSTATVGSTVYKVSRVNNSTGCESPKASITVNVKAPPTATISGPSVVCEENTLITLTFTLTGKSVWTIDYIEKDLVTLAEVPKTVTSSSTTRTVTATPLNSSDYIITKVRDGDGCESTKRDTVRVQFQPCGFKSPMLLWLKANDGPYTDANKFEWRDRSQAFNIAVEAQKASPYSNVAVQNSAINFNQAVVFDGTSSQYLTGTVLNEDGFSVKSTLFTITDPVASSTKPFPQGIFSAHNNTAPGQGLFFNKPSSTPFYVMGGSVLTGANSLSNSGSANIQYPILLRGVYPNETTTQSSQLWENGVSLGTKTSAPYNTYPAITQQFDVGGSTVSPGKVFDGKIAEIIYFHDILSVNEADKVESYLAVKYGIALKKNYLASDGTTVVWNYSGNPTFNTHIAGIGFDAGYALDQRVSHNTSPGDMVTVAHNALSFVTNQSLAASIPADTSYLMWASNNGAKSFGSPDASSGHNLRLLNRRWRARKTGTVNNVSIQFDTVGISIPAGWGRTPALVVTPQSNFSGSFTFYKVASGYPNPTYHNVNLPDGYHFTLVLTEEAVANAGPDQSACSNSSSYEFTMAANSPGVDQAGKWEVVTEPAAGTVTVLSPNLNTTKVRLTVSGSAVLRWIVWNTFSMDADTSYVTVTRHAMPDLPLDFSMPAVCPGAGNDSIVINPSNANYLYKVYATATGGTAIASVYGTGDKITVKPGNKITETTCYYIEIQHIVTQCYGSARWKVCIPVYADMKHPDIRMRVCPSPAYIIDLRTYLNSADIVNATFTSVIPSMLTGGHNVNTDNMQPSSTYAMSYSVTGHCSSSSARIYLQSLNNNLQLPVPKEVRVCWKVDLARNVQLQQILGLDVAGGVWEFDPSLSPQSDYITAINGAYLFNAQKAWLDGKGVLVGTDRYFTFKYYINGSDCFQNSIYEMTVIVTEDI